MDLNNREMGGVLGENLATGDASSAREKAAAFIKNVFFGTLYAICGYLLGSLTLPFGARPFGVALLAVADRNVIYILAGLCLSAWREEDRVLLIGVYVATVLVRLLCRLIIDVPWSRKDGKRRGERTLSEVYPTFFSEHMSLRMASSAVAAFAIGIYGLIEGGFLFYDLYGTVISTLAAPLAVLLVGGFFGKERASGTYRQLVAFLSLSFATVFALGDAQIYGISLSAFLCLFITLYITRRGGTVIGIVSGAVLGLAVSVELVPLFAAAALLCGLLSPISIGLALACALSVGVAWGIYVRGIGVLNGLLSGLVSSTLIFAMADKLFISAPKSKGRDTAAEESEQREEVGQEAICSVMPALELESRRASEARDRIRDMGDGFAEMSRVLLGISKKVQRPSSQDLRQICDNAFDSSCTSCCRRSVCWGERYRETADALDRMTSSLHLTGHLGIDDAGELLLQSCSRLPDIISEINQNTSTHSRQLMESDRTEVFATDYASLAEVLECACDDGGEEYRLDLPLSEQLCRALTEERIGVASVGVFGKRRKKIKIVGRDRETLAEQSAAIEKVIRASCPFSVGAGIFGSAGEATLEFSELERISVVGTQRNLCADGEGKYCGDTSGMFRRADGKLYSFISDGMGSGREASLASGMSGLFLRKLIGSGVSCESALRLLNGFLRCRGSGSAHECSATVDLMELDLMLSRASFYKSGAAPTYVFRNGSLFKIRSHTVPIGILGDLDFRKINFDVSAGDLIVMVSDGVTDGKEECPWLFDILRGQGESASCERLADLVVKYAKNEGATDDISVTVIKIADAAEVREQ